jgi:hypothetical protein
MAQHNHELALARLGHLHGALQRWPQFLGVVNRTDAFDPHELRHHRKIDERLFKGGPDGSSANAVIPPVADAPDIYNFLMIGAVVLHEQQASETAP